MTPITLRDLPRRQRARIYAVALGETSADFALAEALAASAKTGLGAADRRRLAGDAVRYALACHGLHDTTAARIAVTALARGGDPSAACGPAAGAPGAAADRAGDPAPSRASAPAVLARRGGPDAGGDVSPVSDLPAGWLYLEQRRVVVDPSRGGVAAVNGTTADGVMLAGAQRLFAVLVAMEQSAGAVAEDVSSRGLAVDPALVAALGEARCAAAQALLAGEPTEH